ncbi:MAG: PHB depolymerase family esterase [Pseudomonadota bacterium]
MRILIFSTLLALLLALPAHAQNIRDHKTFIDTKMARSYYLHIPKSAGPNAPLVVALHGMGGHAYALRHGIGIDRMAAENGFAVLFPQGANLANGTTSHWNAGFDFSDVDDISFLTRLTETIAHRHGLDTTRIYLLGISNGGYMAYRLACQSPGLFAGLASVAGTMGGADWQNCPARKPLSILHIHAYDDQYIPYDGFTHWASGWGGVPAVPDMISFWVDQFNAKAVEAGRSLPQTDILRFRNERRDVEIKLLSLKGFRHDWPHAQNFAYRALDEIAAFFDLLMPETDLAQAKHKSTK